MNIYNFSENKRILIKSANKIACNIIESIFINFAEIACSEAIVLIESQLHFFRAVQISHEDIAAFEYELIRRTIYGPFLLKYTVVTFKNK